MSTLQCLMSNTGSGIFLRDRCGSTSSAESFSQPPSPPDSSIMDDPRRGRQSNSSRYKTELCRAYEEYGTCKYGEKCQFAHGLTELRSLCRHPKYKTELCRTFHTEGFCPYGKRCHFVHTPKDEMVSLGGKIELSPLDLHPYSEPFYLDGFASPPHHVPHLSSKLHPGFFDPTAATAAAANTGHHTPRSNATPPNKPEFFLYPSHNGPPQDLGELKRYMALNGGYFTPSSSSSTSPLSLSPPVGLTPPQQTMPHGWNSNTTHALHQVLQDVTGTSPSSNSRLPVFSRMNTA